VVRFLVVGLVVSSAVLAATGATYERFAEYYQRQMFPQQGHSLDVGGYRLNLDCSGQGSPAVILDGGVGEPARIWALVQPKIAEFTQVCSYDRAGYGWSDAGPEPRTSSRMVEELNRLLKRAGRTGPFVLVGHSFGGLNVRLYTARYPEQVAGVVLVEASHPDQEAKGFRPPVSPLAWLDPVLLRLGVLRAFFVLDGAPKTPAKLRDELEYLMLQPKAITTNHDEVRGFRQSAAEVRTAGSLGNRPLIVLTGAYSAQRRPQLHEVWIHDLQPDLVRLSTRGKQVVVNSGHSIPLQQPEAVIEAVQEVVGEIRSK
jgi:pimeloyl-ACP methyl ester carboxylesterase